MSNNRAAYERLFARRRKAERRDRRMERAIRFSLYALPVAVIAGGVARVLV